MIQPFSKIAAADVVNSCGNATQMKTRPSGEPTGAYIPLTAIDPTSGYVCEVVVVVLSTGLPVYGSNLNCGVALVCDGSACVD